MQNSNQPLRLLTKRDVLALTGLSYAVLKRLEAKGEFPPRRMISAKRSGWYSDQVQTWIESRPLRTHDDVPAAIREHWERAKRQSRQQTG
jgi:predicted DNA-binding transcriptional regulator AlpA